MSQPRDLTALAGAVGGAQGRLEALDPQTRQQVSMLLDELLEAVRAAQDDMLDEAAWTALLARAESAITSGKAAADQLVQLRPLLEKAPPLSDEQLQKLAELAPALRALSQRVADQAATRRQLAGWLQGRVGTIVVVSLLWLLFQLAGVSVPPVFRVWLGGSDGTQAVAPPAPASQLPAPAPPDGGRAGALPAAGGHQLPAAGDEAVPGPE